jgi:hypothetical protein
MRQLRLPALLAAITGLALESSAASACSRPIRHYSDQEIKQMAGAAFASSTTIVDGEVISPMAFDQKDGTLPVAFIKVSHTWKGSVDDDIAPVAYLSSCDVELGVKGQKVRILLSGTGIFTADQDANGFAAVYQQDTFNREIDRLLGAPRPADFTDPGTLPPDKPAQ